MDNPSGQSPPHPRATAREPRVAGRASRIALARLGTIGTLVLAAIICFGETYSGEAAAPSPPATWGLSGLAFAAFFVALTGAILVVSRPLLGSLFTTAAPFVVLHPAVLQAYDPVVGLHFWVFLTLPLFAATFVSLAGPRHPHPAPAVHRFAPASAIVGGLLGLPVLALEVEMLGDTAPFLFLMAYAGVLAVCGGVIMIDWRRTGGVTCIVAVALALIPIVASLAASPQLEPVPGLLRETRTSYATPLAIGIWALFAVPVLAGAATALRRGPPRPNDADHGEGDGRSDLERPLVQLDRGASL